MSLCIFKSLFRGLGQKLVNFAFRRFDVNRRNADDFGIDGLGSFQCSFRTDAVGLGTGIAGARLRNVGSGYFADIKTLHSLIQALFQQFFVVLLQIDNRLVLHHIQISRGSVNKNRLFNIIQIILFGKHHAVSRFDGVYGLQTIKKRLRNFCRIGISVTIRVANRVFDISIIIGIGAIQRNGRAVTGFGNSDIFINRPQISPLRLQGRIGFISLAQSLKNILSIGITGDCCGKHQAAQERLFHLFTSKKIKLIFPNYNPCCGLCNFIS